MIGRNKPALERLAEEHRKAACTWHIIFTVIIIITLFVLGEEPGTSYSSSSSDEEESPPNMLRKPSRISPPSSSLASLIIAEFSSGSCERSLTITAAGGAGRQKWMNSTLSR
mmetsp:Transcript_18652/g.33057  ORF Transcript_18652/g.33057 Transcript_18652/m.33057 type:complete len:112 (-) Transcript_18652:1002-1337(-)